MKNLLRVCLVASCFYSCKTTALLTASFETETVGTLPAKNIPGSPTGDEITYQSVLEPRIRVVSSASPGEKALEFSQAVAPGLTPHNQFLGFKGINTDLTQPLYFIYTARQFGNFNGLMVDITDGSGGLMARMHIRALGEVTLLENLSMPTITPVGTIPEGASHTVIFTVNASAGTYNLTIFKAGGNISVTDKPLLNVPLAYANPANPTLSIRYDDGDAPSNRYVIESISITKKNPM